jgi:hypothetical protein
MRREAEVNDAPEVYPGPPEGVEEIIKELGVDEPQTYGELKTVLQIYHELDYQEYREEVEKQYRASANEGYDYEQLKAPRNRRIYPVKMDVIENWIADSKAIKEKDLKGGKLCQ